MVDRGRGWLGGFGVGQVVALQVAAAIVLLGLVGGGWLVWAAVGPAALLVLLTLVPVHGRWFYQWMALRLRFLWRVPKPVIDPDVDPRLVPLRELLPELDVLAAEGRGGEQLGIVQDGQAWVAVVGVHADDDLLLSTRPAGVRLPVRSLADVLAVDDVRLAAVQVLMHTVPAPSGLLGGRLGTATSYEQLSAWKVPAAQLVWVALRLDPTLCPDAVAARGGGLDGIYRALRRCVARTVEVLDAAGVRARGLDAEEVRAALALSAGVSPRNAPPGTRHTGEQWRLWTCDGTVHVTYWLRGWPADPARGVPVLLERLVGLPTLFTTLSLTLMSKNDEQIRFRAMVRLSSVSTDAAAHAARALHEATSSAGFRAVRLDGEQAPAVFATMPLGGGVA